MYARDYRAQARAALKGKWCITTLLVLLATILGAGSASGGGVSVASFDFSATNVEGMDAEAAAVIAVIVAIIMLVSLAYSLFLGSFTRAGLINMMDKLLDGENPRADMIFPRGMYWKCVKMNFLRCLYIFLWSLLFIIPGIIAAYRYTMADFILLRNPEMDASRSLRESSEQMKGRKWRLFCLELSFIGWQMLMLTPMWLGLIVGAIALATDRASFIAMALFIFLVLMGLLMVIVAGYFLQSYMNAAIVAFYRDAGRAAQWSSEAQAGSDYARSAYGAAVEVPMEDAQSVHSAEGQAAPAQEAARPDETVARDLFIQHGCSRAKLWAAGLMEEYEKLSVDPSAEFRWIRDHGQALMLRFNRDPAALDDLLILAGEYGLDDLIGRILERIERHVRQETLPPAEILNMAGRVLALLVSGAFGGNEGFISRKKAQISDIADRLERRLEQDNAEGDWPHALELIRQMCAN